MPRLVIDELNINMVQAVKHSHSGLLGCAGDVFTETGVSNFPHEASVLLFHPIHLVLLGAGLAGLADNVLSGIADSLALIGLWGTETPDNGRSLTNCLLVDSLDR